MARQRVSPALMVIEGDFMKIVQASKLSATAALLALGNAASAQSSSYTSGSAWTFSNIQIERGQFENYMDYLDKEFEKQNDFGVKEGYIVSCHVFRVNNARAGEPDLILAIEGKDYFSNAQQLALQQKFEAYTAKDSRKMTVESGDRKAMRELIGGMELRELKLKEGVGAGCPDNGAMSAPFAHRVLAADLHTVPRPFRAFAVRSDEPRHAFDARPPYGCVHVVATDFIDAAARAGLMRTGYAKVDIDEPFAVDYAATTLAELQAAAGRPGLVRAIAQGLRVTRVLGDDLADYERSVATRVDYLASRGAGFHNDVARHWSRSLFWILAVDVSDVEFVLVHADVRVALAPGDLVVFDQVMAHGLCRPADAGQAMAESFDDGNAGRQLFLTGEMQVSDAQWAALGAPWQPVDVADAAGALDLMLAEFDDRSGAIKRVRSLAACMKRETCHVDETSGAQSHSERDRA
jgi:hypothetical protein